MKNKNVKVLFLSLKLNVQRLFFPVILLITNLIIFILNPVLLEGFIQINFSGSTEQVLDHSFSLTRIVLIIIYFISGIDLGFWGTLLVFLSIFSTVFVIAFWMYIKNRSKEQILPLFYAISLLILLIGYFDSWAHHLIVLSPFIVISLMLLKNSRIDAFEKKGDLDKTQIALQGEFNVKHKEYRQILYLYVGTGMYFWIILWLVTGINILYGLIVLAQYLILIKILHKSS